MPSSSSPFVLNAAPTKRVASSKRRRALWVVPLGVLLTGVVPAEAAPTGEPTPPTVPSARVGPRALVSGIPGLTVSATGPHRSTCGRPIRIDLQVRNDARRSWPGGTAYVVSTGGLAGAPVAIPAIEGERAVSVTATGPTLNCRGPLTTHTLRVFAGATLVQKGAPFFEKSFRPNGFEGRKDLLTTPPNRLALQTVRFFGTCGGSVTALATFWQGPPPSGVPSTATASLRFGATGANFLVRSNNPSSLQATLNVPGPFDCTVSTGIPFLDFAVEGDAPERGTIEPESVTFE